MLDAEPFYRSVLNLRDPALSEVHSSAISIHHAKEGYDYPTIRLPHTLSKLAGLPTQIYRTLHKGALAFLVVIASSYPATKDEVEKSTNVVNDPASSVFTQRGSRLRISPSPSFLRSLGEKKVAGAFFTEPCCGWSEPVSDEHRSHQ